MVVKETLVICDGCGEQCGGDDRNESAAQIRKARKTVGWTQRGKKDYCADCSDNIVDLAFGRGCQQPIS
jgi:hypothetical protein